jgi:hypothetical protein
MARISTFERMQLLKRHEESVAEQISGLDTVQGIVRFARAAYRLEAGLVVPNLIGDSDLEKKEEDSAYSRHPHLANILDFSITNCRINAVRRGKVFEAWGYSREKQESTSPDVQRFFDSVAYAN